jgi:hypothetical protein
MNISVTTDTKANDRVIRASSFTVNDKGFLHVIDEREGIVAIFAPGAWLSAQKDTS